MATDMLKQSESKRSSVHTLLQAAAEEGHFDPNSTNRDRHSYSQGKHTSEKQMLMEQAPSFRVLPNYIETTTAMTDRHDTQISMPAYQYKQEIPTNVMQNHRGSFNSLIRAADLATGNYDPQ